MSFPTPRVSEKLKGEQKWYTSPRLILNGPIDYRLGRQVFILESGVRFPVGLQ